MSKNYFNNKTAIITGASSGIGKATALALAEHGANVALGSRNIPALDSVAQQIQSMGREVLVVPTDVTQQVQVENLVGQTISRWGQVNILVVNAGQYIRSPISQLTVPIMEASMAVNFYGGLYAILAVLPHMQAQDSGHIVIVCSMAAEVPVPPDAPYVAAKSALSGFGKILRQELYRTDVNVSIIYPGRVDTPLIEGLQFHWLSAKIPPETVAREIVRSIYRRKTEVIIVSLPGLMLHYLTISTPRIRDYLTRLFRLEGWEA